ncbi:hypothetical protein GOP47_0018276 [Adiantum capillus-veneris]|uniref:Dirigent protein n=1 Tax=Adiantum capillus-veneris TaxID=13818 RepID=A0A9D4Z9Z4_ADICA|nr:hypothetical protein GOP47_0018276 [Adiantum capillus-veneris]
MALPRLLNDTSLFILLFLSLPTMNILAATPPPPNLTVYNLLSVQGPNSTTGYNTVQCGLPSLPQNNTFAQTFCFDMPLLAEPNLDSELLGKVQGSYIFVSLSGGTLFVSESFTINNTIHQGTFTGVGLEYIGKTSSKPITGGTDDFAFVSGVATTTPLSNGTDSEGNYYAWFMYEFIFQ